MRSRVILECRTCSGSFRPWQGREKSSRYCSRACAYADPSRMPKNSLGTRFWRLVDSGGPDECWPWLGAKSGHLGYGQIYYNGGHIGAHRASYLIHNGELPERAFICHTCDNAWCVNPAHLYAGTQASNVDDMDQRGRRRVGGATKLIGETHPGSKLTAERVSAIRHDRRSSRATAADYGISATLVRNIRARRTWKHI